MIIMKRAAILLVSIGLMTGLAASVVGHNDTGEGDVSITSGGSAGATAGVNENGTQYTAKVEMSGRNPNQTDNQVTDIGYDDHQRVEFNGTITAGTPCHVIEHELNETGEETYTLNIQTERDEPDNEACADVVTGINYEAGLEADSGFRLKVRYHNKTIQILEDRVVEPEPEPSLIQRLLDFLGL